MGLGYVRTTATAVVSVVRICVYLLLLLLYDNIYRYLAFAWRDAVESSKLRIFDIFKSQARAAGAVAFAIGWGTNKIVLYRNIVNGLVFMLISKRSSHSCTF